MSEKTTQETPLFDVLAVDLDDKRVRVIATDRDEANADAVISIAVARRGVIKEFFVKVRVDRYRDGDVYVV